MAKVADCFASYEENISSLSVIPTELPEIAKMTIVSSLTLESLNFIEMRLKKLVAIRYLNVAEMEKQMRGQVLAKVEVGSSFQLMSLKRMVHDLDGDCIPLLDSSGNLCTSRTVMVHVAAEHHRIEAILEKLKSYNVIEVQKSSPVFLHKEQRTWLRKETASSCSTVKLHTDDAGRYSISRLRLHARIAQQLYDHNQKDIQFPNLVLLLGIPGSGKTSILRYLDVWKNIDMAKYTNFDVDECLAMLPEFYESVLNVGLGMHAQNGFILDAHLRYKRCQEEAKFIISKNRQVALMNRQNMIVHGSGKSYDAYFHLIEQANAAGYSTSVVCVDVPKHVAYQRVKRRAKSYGRDVPKSIIDLAYKKIAPNFSKLTKIANKAVLFDSVQRPPKLVWRKGEIMDLDNDDILNRYKLT